jgi:hypothetical protein
MRSGLAVFGVSSLELCFLDWVVRWRMDFKVIDGKTWGTDLEDIYHKS